MHRESNCAQWFLVVLGLSVLFSGGGCGEKSPTLTDAELEQIAITEKIQTVEKAGGLVWVPQGALVRPVQLTLGLSDGSLMEVESTELKEGTPLVVGEMESQQAGKPAPGASPFTPQLLRKSANTK